MGLIFAKVAAVRININTDSSPVAMGRTHVAHVSHASRLLSSSYLITSAPSPLPQLSAQGTFSSGRHRLLHSVVHSFSFSPPPVAPATLLFSAVIKNKRLAGTQKGTARPSLALRPVHVQGDPSGNSRTSIKHSSASSTESSTSLSPLGFNKTVGDHRGMIALAGTPP